MNKEADETKEAGVEVNVRMKLRPGGVGALRAEPTLGC